jgi:hypothetical protein
MNEVSSRLFDCSSLSLRPSYMAEVVALGKGWASFRHTAEMRIGVGNELCHILSAGVSCRLSFSKVPTPPRVLQL